jgi:dolichol-phosphate mannosyltransferase
VFEYAGLLLAKVSGDALSTRFLLFMLVGVSGLGAHLLALRSALGLPQVGFDLAQAGAAYVAMTWNFFLNNLLTYRDRRLKGVGVLKGLLSFYAVCSVGAVANVGVASWIYGEHPTWWLAGTAGALMGGVFNYVASSTFTWCQR